MAQKPTGEKVISVNTTSPKGVNSSIVTPLVVVDGKIVADTTQGVVQ